VLADEPLLPLTAVVKCDLLLPPFSPRCFLKGRPGGGGGCCAVRQAATTSALLKTGSAGTHPTRSRARRAASPNSSARGPWAPHTSPRPLTDAPPVTGLHLPGRCGRRPAMRRMRRKRWRPCPRGASARCRCRSHRWALEWHSCSGRVGGAARFRGATIWECM